MATLTGFKATGEQTGQQAQNGQQNPVFVFDDVDGANNDDEFKDASSEQPNENEPTSVVVYTSDTDFKGSSSESVKPEKKNVSSATDNQVRKISGRQQRAASAANQQNSSLSPNDSGSPGKNVSSASMLSIDCSGKSPDQLRQPRRSPLMALFKGKPRESVRKLYTDEDQFEIEWSDLRLRVQKKWYQSLSYNNLFNRSDLAIKPEGPLSKLILNNVDGRIKSGEITAVLGPSGAGKTSLLNSLFGKYRTTVEGKIKVTGAPSKKHLTVCTIPQNDYLIGHLTTEESLWFASRLKNCEWDFNHDRNIERVIELLGLQRCRNTRINKLSGGQYKRVSIAQEMLSSPDILVLDEPTSGLDSLTCYRTIKVLRDLVEASKAHNLVNPMSIILTIHQPHREVLDLFHSVYVMAVGGQTLYQGPPSEMEDWISLHSGTRMPSLGYNPASFMVEIASEEYGRKPIDLLVKKQREKFQKSMHQQSGSEKQNSNEVQNNSQSKSGAPKFGSGNKKADSTITLYPLDPKDKYIDVDLNADRFGSTASSLRNIDTRVMTPRSGKNSDGVFWHHVSLMSKRCLLSNTRDPLLCTIRIGAHIFIPLVVALIYGPQMGVPNGCPTYMPEINLLEYASAGVEEIEKKHDDIRVQFQNVGLHFMVYYAFGLCMLAFTAISFPLIMHVLIKEIRNGWYSLGTFIVGKMIAELPMSLIMPPISVGIIYTLTGQPSSPLQWRYMVQSLILVLIIMIAEAKGLVFGAVFMNSMQTAVFAASVSTVPFILLSGFLIRIREVPQLLQFLANFSYFRYAVEALIITRYGFDMCGKCDQNFTGGTPMIVGISPQVMSLTDYYMEAYARAEKLPEEVEDREPVTETNIPGNNRNLSRIMSSIASLPPEIVEMETTKAMSLPDTTTAVASPLVADTTTPVSITPAETIPVSSSTSAAATMSSEASSSTEASTAAATMTSETSSSTEASTAAATMTSEASSSTEASTAAATMTSEASSSTEASTAAATMSSEAASSSEASSESSVPVDSTSTASPSQDTNPTSPLAANGVSEAIVTTISSEAAPTTTVAATIITAAADSAMTETTVASVRAKRALEESAELADDISDTTLIEGADATKKPKKKKQGVFFSKLAELLTRANAFGFSIESCKDIVPFTMKDMRLEDSMLPLLIFYLFLYIVILKLLSYFIVNFCVKLKL